jgi:hypothetical protein
LDKLLNGHNLDEVLEEDETNDLVDSEADIQDVDARTAGFTTYMQDALKANLAAPVQSSMLTPPTCDASIQMESITLLWFFALAKDMNRSPPI